jgi:hypothetical protein
VVHGYKPIENRPPKFTQRAFRGPFWVHAGLHQDQAVWYEARKHADTWLGTDFVMPPLTELVFGAIIGRASIVGVHAPVTASLWAPKAPVPWHFHDQYGLVLEGAALVSSPVPCRGLNGFWPVQKDDLETLRRRST